DRAKDPSPAVRRAVLLVQRRWADARLVQFLDDSDLDLVTEAARAINDVPVEPGTEALARVLERFARGAPGEAVPLLRRAIHANYRLGTAVHARAVGRVAANPAFAKVVRAEALAALSDWVSPPPRDRVTGFWRPLPKRDAAVVR